MKKENSTKVPSGIWGFVCLMVVLFIAYCFACYMHYEG